ncbi:hypothetical protein CLOM_g1429 [Closterium sp. NIES-68]|nr:hypothetical protein CLOM_g1429 [Closterium sp. NIES-68]GJP68925.1 hypothetical protein CLOP_g25565 [Closterium sp. NIES-67]
MLHLNHFVRCRVGVDKLSGVHVAVKMLSKRIVTAMKGEGHRASEIEILLALQRGDAGKQSDETKESCTSATTTSDTTATTTSSTSSSTTINSGSTCSTGIAGSVPGSTATASSAADSSNPASDSHAPASIPSCPGVLPVLGTFEDNRFLFLVSPLMAGGDLLSHIASRPKFSERHASAIVRHVLKTLACLHSKGIAHLDINPNNILFPSTPSKHPHLVDFGSAIIIPPEGATSPSPGTAPFFAAPEVSQKRVFTQAADMWSLGAVLFLMVGGVPPKTAVGKAAACSQQVHGNASWLRLQAGDVEGLPDDPSPELLDFLPKLLTPNRSERIKAHEALSHPWVSTPACKLRQSVLQTAVRNCKEYVSRRAAGCIGSGVVSCSTPRVYEQDARKGAGATASDSINRKIGLHGTDVGVGGSGHPGLVVVDGALDLEPVRKKELKWKSVGSVITADIREFAHCEVKTKVFVEVLECDAPRKARLRSRDYSQIACLNV